MHNTVHLLNQQSLFVVFETYHAFKCIVQRLQNLFQTFIVGTHAHSKYTATFGQIVKLLKLYSLRASRYVVVVIMQSQSAHDPNQAVPPHLERYAVSIAFFHDCKQLFMHVCGAVILASIV